jgi:hypothetical protein
MRGNDEFLRLPAFHQKDYFVELVSGFGLREHNRIDELAGRQVSRFSGAPRLSFCSPKEDETRLSM